MVLVPKKTLEELTALWVVCEDIQMLTGLSVEELRDMFAKGFTLRLPQKVDFDSFLIKHIGS